MDSLALELGCKVGALPSSYLGLPLGAPHNSVTVWDGIEERFRKRLVLWKRQYISKGGRITLIRSTLSSLPIYFLFFGCLDGLDCASNKFKEIFFGVVAFWRKNLIL